MADKKFSEFDLANIDNQMELVGLQNGTNVKTGLVKPVFKDINGDIEVEGVTANLFQTVDSADKFITDNIQSRTGDALYFTKSTNIGVPYQIIHQGNLDLLPDVIVDHGALTGLEDNDHPQYALLTGATFSGALRAELDPVADRDVVPFKYLKDELAKGAFRGVQWKYGGSTATAPASGYMKIVVTTGQNREILLNDVDANGYTRSCAAILAGDTLVISTSPTAFARYMVTAKAIDNGTHWTIPALRTDTQGSQTPPPVDTVLTVTATLSGTDVVEEYIPISQKGAPDGVAPLDSTQHIPSQFINITGFQYMGGWNAAPGILPPDGASGDVYTITNEGTLLVVPPSATNDTPVNTLCLNGEIIGYHAGKDQWYLFTANTAIGDSRYVQLAGSTMTGHLSVPAGASGSQVRRASETDTLLAAKAPLASPALTGIPTAPTAAIGTNTQQLATTAFVKAGTIPWTTGNKGDLLSYDGAAWVATAPAEESAKGNYQFDTAITTNPVSGDLRFNTAVYSTTTRIYINHITFDGTDAEIAFQKLLVGDRVYLQTKDDATQWVKYDVTALPVDMGTWWDIPVSYFDSSGLLFSNNEALAFVLTYKGSSIAGGDGDVAGPDSAVDLNVAVFDGVTGKVIKDGGARITTSSSDMTANRLLKTKDFGIGVTALAKVIDWDTEFDAVNGTLPQIMANTGSTNGPGSAGTPYWYPQVMGYSSLNGNKTVIAWPYRTASEGAPWMRSRYSTAWSPWRQLVFSDSPTFLGTPTAPTATAGNNTTQIATTQFVTSAVSSNAADKVVGPASATDSYIPQWNGSTGKLLKNGIPVSTFATPADVALKADKTYVDTQDALKAPLASPALTGTPTAPTATQGTNSTQLATTAFVVAADALKANLNSPALTGVPTAPTATVGTNNTQIATTAFVLANASSGSGDVVGPASSTDSNIPLFNGATGKILKDSGVRITTSATDTTAGRVLTVGAGKVQLGNDVGDVKGPASSAIDGVAVFADTTGKILKQSSYSFGTAAGANLITSFSDITVGNVLTVGARKVQLGADVAGTASPAFTGTPTAPTAANGTNTTQIATTAFVLANAGSSGLPTTGGTLTGKLTIEQNVGAAGVYGSGQLELRCTDNGIASLGFHRSGSTAAQMRHTQDGLYFSGNSQTAAISVASYGNVVGYSDIRLKENVRDIEGALDKILASRGVIFDRLSGEKDQMGVIAQEIMKQIPEVVAEGEGYYHVAYGNLAGIFIEGFKDMYKELVDLRNRVEVLENGTSK